MIYFDNAATRKPFEDALSSYEEISNNYFGNPKSNHILGFQASKKLEEARQGILELLNLSKTHKLIFTSGATESNNLAIKGIAYKYKNRGNKIISCVSEHPSIIEPLKLLKEEGFDVIFLPINSNGEADLHALEKEIDNNTILVSLMSVNNEIGSINDIKAIRNIINKYPKCFFHIDATQSMGKNQIDYSFADLISFSSHKFGGLKGNGGLIYKNNITFKTINAGGGQEYGFRSGTNNLAGAYSSFVALKHAYKSILDNFTNVSAIKNYLVNELTKNSEIELNSPSESSPYILNFSLKNKKASVVVEALSELGICVSTLSACSSTVNSFSSTIIELGKSREIASNSIRISFEDTNSIEEAKIFIQSLNKILAEVVNR